MSETPRAARPTEIPVLDISGFPDANDDLARILRKACETTGFFYVTGHGISRETVEALLVAMRRYFALPLAERMKSRIDRFRRGYMALNETRHEGYEPDLKESYSLGLDLPLTDPDVMVGKPLHGPNLWLPEHEWFRVVAEAYFAENIELGFRLMRLFSRSLALPDNFFVQFCKKPVVRTRLLHYPEQAVAKTGKQVAAAPHTDFAMFTILHQDPVGGLEICKRDGEWIRAPYVEGSFVINVGDLLARWTNDVYASTPHRVISRAGKERYSIATFFNPDFDTPVACLETCRSETRPAAYEPVLTGNYLMGRYRDTQKVGVAAAG
jgi:isopenicillin N synthase-like dioxygenase